MYQLGDLVMYGIHGVCQIKELETKVVDRKKVEYFVLVPLAQPATRYYVPLGNPAALAKIRKLLTTEELALLLSSDDVRKDVWISDENQRKQHYRSLFNTCDRLAILQMIRTLYIHRQIQSSSGRKFHLCDENFLRDAEKLISSEFSIILGISSSEAIEYISSRLQEE